MEKNKIIKKQSIKKKPISAARKAFYIALVISLFVSPSGLGPFLIALIIFWIPLWLFINIIRLDQPPTKEERLARLRADKKEEVLKIEKKEKE